jgi:hypothetical protein
MRSRSLIAARHVPTSGRRGATKGDRADVSPPVFAPSSEKKGFLFETPL